MQEVKEAEIIDQAVRSVIQNGKDAVFILDREGTICFLNRKAAVIIGKSERDLVGKRFEDEASAIAEEKEEIKAMLEPAEKGTFFKLWISAPYGTISAEICSDPIMSEGENIGTVLTLRTEPLRSQTLRSLETLGSAIQRHSTAQKIFEALKNELATLGITFMVLTREKASFSIAYHTSNIRKMHITEFIMGVPLSEMRLKVKPDAFKRITEQKSLFFYEISSLMESKTPNLNTSELHKFFSLVGFSRGVAVPLQSGDDLTGILALFSEGFQPEDAPIVSALGVQVSSALERADYFSKLVGDLKTLEEQIKARTWELEKVRSQMESIVQSSVDAIIAADMEGRVTFVNRGVETMFGYTQAEMLGHSLTPYYAEGEREARILKKRILRERQIENVELDFIAEDGKIVHTLASLSLLKDEKGKETGIMAVLKDITEQKRLQETLESLNKAAFRIQKSKVREEIFAVTAEELKRFNFYVLFMLFNAQRTVGRVVYITSEDLLETLAEQEDIRVSDLELPLDNPLCRRLIRKAEAIYLEDVQTAAELLVPSSLYEISWEGIKLLGIEGKRAIVAPLIIQGETIGILGVISDIITAHDTPSIMAFANQVSIALENARLLEEHQAHAVELTKNLEEQQLLRELNTKLFVARSQEDVLDAAIEGIHTLGKSFSNISLLNEERTHATIVRVEMDPVLQRTVENAGRTHISGFTMLGYHVPLREEDNIYHQFFDNQIPLVTSNIDVHHPVMKADLSQIYSGFAERDASPQSIIEIISHWLPYQSVMVFPIIVEGSTIGTLTVTSREEFSEEDFHLMRTVAEMVSSAMERIRRSEKLAMTFSELEVVQRINTLLNMGASFEQILVHIASSIKKVYHYRFAVPVLLDPSRTYLTFEYVVLPSEIAGKLRDLGVDLKELKYPFVESGLLNRVFKEKKCVIVRGFEELAESITHDSIRSVIKNIAHDFPRALGLDPEETYVMIVPLPCGEEVIGMLVLGHNIPLREKDFHRLEYFLDQVSIAIAKSDAENRLRQSLRELQELDRMKSEFIDIASHELRTPMTTLKLYLEMMAMEQYGKLSTALKERVQVMQEGVNRLEEIINQTLVASRLIKKTLDIEKHPVSLVDISAEVVRQLSPLWKAKNQNIFVESPSALSEIEGDRKALFTVMSNLVDNAIRYSPENTEILIKCVEHPEDVECMVIDQGCGFPPEHAERVFEEFYIVPSETESARMDGRTGLGLFIAKGIVERHRGKIWVESTPGKGSTFHVVMPKQ